MKDREVKQVLTGNGYQWVGGKDKERVKGDEYDGSVLYLCMKIDP
jgi:hypothetical protein